MVCLKCVILQAVLQHNYEMPQGEYLSTWSTIPADVNGIGNVAGIPTSDANTIEAKLKEAHCEYFSCRLMSVCSSQYCSIAFGAYFCRLPGILMGGEWRWD
jgi:hypothetical protein